MEECDAETMLAYLPKESLPRARRFFARAIARRLAKSAWLHCDADSSFSTEFGFAKRCRTAPGPHLGGPDAFA